MGQRRRFVNVKDVDLKTPICSNVNMNLLNHNISQLLLRLNINLDECTNDRIECNYSRTVLKLMCDCCGSVLREERIKCDILYGQGYKEDIKQE